MDKSTTYYRSHFKFRFELGKQSKWLIVPLRGAVFLSSWIMICVGLGLLPIQESSGDVLIEALRAPGEFCDNRSLKSLWFPLSRRKVTTTLPAPYYDKHGVLKNELNVKTLEGQINEFRARVYVCGQAIGSSTYGQFTENPRYTGPQIYDVDGVLKAVFSSEPALTGEISDGKQKHRGYNSTDENQLIIYTATIQVDKIYYEEHVIPEALRQFIKGQAKVTNGTIRDQLIRKDNGNMVGLFVLEYEVGDKKVKKYGKVIYFDGRFFQWAVQEIVGFSSNSAKSIFDNYVQYFSVK